MALHLDLTFDCVDGGPLGEFWKLALGYEDEPPPPPFATRKEWLAHYGETGDGPTGAWLRDPDGIGPRLSFLPVPEPKVAKNRLHIDVRVPAEGTPEERWAAITGKVARLTDAGATTLATFEGHHVVMADPEGNEFCVAYAAASAPGG